MNVKVQCPCGTRFEFPVEPVNERMPVPIACPVCGADATELANEVIRRQLAAAPAANAPTPVPVPRISVPTAVPAASAAPALSIPSAPRIPTAAPAPAPIPTSAPAPSAPRPVVRVATGAPAPAPVASAAPAAPAVPAGGSLRINRGHAEAADAAPAASHGPGTTIKCARHLTEPSTDHCHVCGKPICPKCMENFGYLCSVYCREQADAKGIDVPVFAGQKAVIHRRSNKKVSTIAWSVTATVSLLLVVWIWYTWFARTPRLVYSADVFTPHYLDKVYRIPDYYRLIGPNQLLAVKDKSVVLMDPTANKAVWTTPLRTEAEIKAADAARAKNDHIRETTPKYQDEHGRTVQRLQGIDPLEEIDDHLFDNPHAVATSNDIWVTFASGMVRLDRATGAKKDFTGPSNITSIVPGNETFLIMSRNTNGSRSLTRLAYADGSMQSEDIPLPPGMQPRPLPGAAPRSGAPARGTPGATTPSRGTPITMAPARGTPTTMTPARGTPATMTPARGTPAPSATAPARGTAPAIARGTPPPAATAPRGARPVLMDPDMDPDDEPTVTPVNSSRGGGLGSLAAIDLGDDDIGDMFMSGVSHGPYIDAGPNVVEFDTKLIERKTITPTTTKRTQPKPATTPAKPTTSVLDNKNLNASMSVDLAREMMGATSSKELDDEFDSQDVSIYEYSIHRFFAKEASNVTAQIVGDPHFSALKTVDLVAGNSNVIAYDKNNKKLWETKLTFPAAGPALETSDAVYFADRGTLMRIDKANGNVVWRLQSIGISAIQTDSKGGIYVDTTTAKPETSKLNSRFFSPKGEHQIMKVDPAKGTMLWHRELGSTYFHLMPIGEYLYSERSWESQDMTKLGEGTDAHYNIKLHNPSSGGVVWNYPVNQHRVVRSEISGKWIMLHFRDKIMVLKYFSL